MPKIEAFLHEVLRISTIIPQGIPHMASQDLKLAGYDIPKGTPVIMNLLRISRNANSFPEPMQFKPDRFIQNGKFETQSKEYSLWNRKKGLPWKITGFSSTFYLHDNNSSTVSSLCSRWNTRR